MQVFSAPQRKACELVQIARSTFRYRADKTKDYKLKEKLTALAHDHPRYGYRRLAVLLRREGEILNHKRLFRLYKEAGLSVRRKKRSGWSVLASRSTRPRLRTSSGHWTSCTIGLPADVRSAC